MQEVVISVFLHYFLYAVWHICQLIQCNMEQIATKFNIMQLVI